MPTLSFRVPANLPGPVIHDLLRSAIAGGHDRAPTSTQCELRDEQLFLTREINESSAAYIPWEVRGKGRFVFTTTTLMFRERPYDLVIELARGKLNQVRNQYADWRAGGLSEASDVENLIRQATRLLGEALLDSSRPESDRLANQSLTYSLDAVNQLIHVYQDQVFQLRHHCQGKLDSVFGCGIRLPPPPSLDDAFRLTFNTANVPLTWRIIEPSESDYRWAESDAAIDWAIERNLHVHAGPLIDFSPHGLPNFVRRLGNDLVTLKSLMCDYVETVVNRYRGKVTRWSISSGANGTIPLGVSEEDLIRLTAMAADAAWQIDSNLQLSFGVSSPWGDYLSDPSYQYSPFVYADTLLRAGLPFSGIDIELFLGSSPRGSYCRDLLETSRILDLFGLLGLPLHVGLAYPSSPLPDALADPMERNDLSGFDGDMSSGAQGKWAEAFTTLVLCKSFVAGVIWDNLADQEPHRFPHAGLIDQHGTVKPTFDHMRAIREKHLR